MTLHQNQAASAAAKDWVENGKSYTRVFEMVEKLKAEAHCAEMAKSAPQLSFEIPKP
jgi:hypothetical protein